MYSRPLTIINKQNIFSNCLVGYRNSRSTCMVMIILVDNLVDALVNGNVQWEYF